jgi:hypothetical protein
MGQISKTGRCRLFACFLWLALGCAVRGQSQQVTLQWLASSAPGVTGYNLCYGTTSGVYTVTTNAGTNTTFTVSGLVGGTTYYFSAASYNATGIQGSYSPEISYLVPRILTVTASSVSRPFGQANPVLTGIISGLVSGNDITATYNCGATSDSPVGTYAITPTLIDPNDLETNYMVDLVGGVLTVTPAAPLVTWTNPVPIIYGAALTLNQLNATANLPGSFTYNPGSGAVLNAGTNTLSVLFTPTDSVDYNTATNKVEVVVSKAPLTVTASNASRAYGQTNPVFAGAIAGLTNGDEITVAYSCGATTSSRPGTYAIVPRLVDPNNRQTNYTVSLASSALTVSQALPIMAWSNATPIHYGAALTSEQLNATANVPGSFAYDPTNGTVLDSGTRSLYVIFTPMDAVDYSSATNAVDLVVLRGALTVTASNAIRGYGQANPGFGGAITSLTNGDIITANYTCSATTNSPPGTYAIVPTLVDPDNRRTNYTVSLDSGTLTVGYLLHIDTSNIASTGAQLTMSAIPGQAYWVQVSTNLVDWANLSNVTANSDGIVEVLDAGARDFSQRFYRATPQ